MEKISMLKIKEVLRLQHDSKLSARKISRALNLSHTVVNQYIKRFLSSGYDYEVLMVFSDKEIVNKLFNLESKPSKYPIPNWSQVHIYLLWLPRFLDYRELKVQEHHQKF